MRKKMLATILAAAVVVTAVPMSGIGVMAEEDGEVEGFSAEMDTGFEGETDYIIDEQAESETGFYDENEIAEVQEINPDGFECGDLDEMAETDEGIDTQAANDGQIIIKDADGNEQIFNSLQEAIDSAPTGVDVTSDQTITQIYVKGDIKIDKTVVISGQRNISIVSADTNGVTIGRATDFKGDMFQITGGSSFQFGLSKYEDTVLNLVVNGELDDYSEAEGSIITMDSGYFGMTDGTKLTGNYTKTAGAAIYNKNGKIKLSGGIITKNQSSIGLGAIYSEGEICVSGTVIVKENRDDGVTENSIILNTDNAYLTIIGILGEATDLQIRRNDAAEGKHIVTLEKDAEGNMSTMTTALLHIHYLDSENYIINQAGILESTKGTVSSIELVADSIAWSKPYEHMVEVKFHATGASTDGQFYAIWTKSSESTPNFETVKSNPGASGAVSADKVQFSLANVDYDTKIKVIIYAEDNNGLTTKPLILTLDEKTTPVEPDKPSRDTINPSVSESKITGLEEPLAFYPKKMYNFQVTGAGEDNKAPIKNDTKWVPYGWSMSSKNINTGYQKSWSIGNVNGIKQAKTFKMYIFFQKFIYNGSEWEATDEKDALPQEFQSKEIEFTVDPLVSPTPTPAADPTVTPVPATPTPIPPYTPNVSQSVVKGLEGTLSVTPGKTYQFTVTGAGTQNTNPINGDWQWKPLYWSFNANPTASQRKTIGKIEYKDGVTKSGTYDMYIFFQKYVYDGIRRVWNPTNDIQSMKYQLYAKLVSPIPSSLTLKKGKTSTLKPASSWKNVKYSTSNKKIVTVDKKGKIKAVAAGTAKITVKSGSKKAVCTITVPGTTSIKNIKSSVNVKKGKSTTLKPKLSYAGSPDTITYKSSNKKIATVSKYGKITGKKKGTATITIKSGKIIKKCKVKVK